jgi:hypothetical protein
MRRIVVTENVSVDAAVEEAWQENELELVSPAPAGDAKLPRLADSPRYADGGVTIVVCHIAG